MAGKGASGVSNFVHSRDADSQGTRADNAPQTRRSHDDLKISTAKTPGANTRQIRTTAQPRGKQDRVQSELRCARRDSSGGKPFYGTDASIESSSVSSGTRHHKTDVTGATENGHTNGRVRAVDAGDFAGNSEYEFGSDDVEDDIADIRDRNGFEALGGGLSESAKQLMAQKEGSGIARTHMKGDTYPPTTSGTPSVDNLNDTKNVEKRSRAQSQGRNGQAPTMNAQPPASNVHDQRPQRQIKAELDQGRSKVQGGLLVDPRKDDRPVQQQLTEEFMYSKPKPNKPTVPIFGQQQARTQPAPSRIQSRQQISNNTADRATLASMHENDNVAARQIQASYHPVDIHGQSPRQHRSATRSQKQQQAPSQAEQRPIDQDFNSDHFSEVDDGVQGEVAANIAVQQEYTEHHEPGKMDLDYDREELINMDYSEIKAESFDIDPKAGDFNFSEDDSITDLDSKIQVAAGLPPQHQSKFFASLSIDEWEQAGDWFITRFSEVLNKLKTNRKDTRDAAKAFEGDIEKRHGAVSKKRKQIDDELTEMRESGGKVLQGTPKKAKMK